MLNLGVHFIRTWQARQAFFAIFEPFLPILKYCLVFFISSGTLASIFFYLAGIHLRAGSVLGNPAVLYSKKEISTRPKHHMNIIMSACLKHAEAPIHAS